MATEAAASYIDTLLKRVAARGAGLGIRFESGALEQGVDVGGCRFGRHQSASSVSSTM